MNSVILIGMPGAGKSTVGVVLAKTLGRGFCDTDLLIQNNEKDILQNIIDKFGIEYFKKCEETNILGESFENMVIATGGSVVYSAKAMEHLKKFGVVVYLNVTVLELEKRINNFSTRGIIGVGSISNIYKERHKLYEKYADITVKPGGSDIEDTVRSIMCKLS